MTISRRSLLALGITSPLVARDLWATPQLPPLSLSVAVAEVEGEPVVSADWIEEQIAEAQRLMKPHGVDLALVRRRAIDAKHAQLDNAGERDSLATLIQPGVINAFMVGRLRDLSARNRFISGVRWRFRRDVSRDYVIVSSTAGSLTLCHELGHFLGNRHSYVVNNVMSYLQRDYDKVRFDERQGAKMRRVAKALLRAKKVLPAAEWRRVHAPDDNAEA